MGGGEGQGQGRRFAIDQAVSGWMKSRNGYCGMTSIATSQVVEDGHCMTTAACRWRAFIPNLPVTSSPLHTSHHPGSTQPP